MDTPSLTLPDPLYVVVTEYDCDREWRLRNGRTTPHPMGPVIKETYLTRPIGRAEALMLQERLGHKFGRTLVMRLVPARSVEQVRSDFDAWMNAEYPQLTDDKYVTQILWAAYRAAVA